MRFLLKSLPISYSAWDEGLGNFGGIYHEAMFMENFGHISAGRSYNALHIEWVDGTIHEMTASGKIGDLLTRFKGVAL